MSDDSVKGADGFLEIRTKNGWVELWNLSDIQIVRARKEGGTLLRRAGRRVMLIDVPIDDVVAAMKAAEQGGRHESSTG